MCGIAGVVGDGRQEVPPESVGLAMNAAILHRGPDGGGVHREPQAMLGMRRLAIIDLGGGQQPMHSDEGALVLVFNGEIYNFRRLRAELQRLGHAFRTDSDTEVILRAYERWGDDAVRRLEGMFAFALWDRRRQRLLLARDRFGKKPLFVRRHGGTLAFASELKSFLALPGFDRAFDPGVLPAYFAFGYVPAPRCVFADVRKLPPGHYAVYEAGRYQEHCYWSLGFEPTFGGGEAEAVERLGALLTDAVDDRLVADVPFGAFLSGGLDSSVVVALMAQRLTRPVKTFSIGFREARYSELADARRVATHLGTEHHELVVEPDATRLASMLAWHLDEPFADSSALPTYLVSELAARHVKMVLSGDGGDEAFGGYDRYLRQLTLERLGPARRPLALALGALGALLPGRTGFRLGRIGERLRLGAADRYLSSVALSRPDQTTALIGPAGAEGYASLHPLFAREAHRPLLDRMVATDIGSYLPDDILVKLDRTTMAASLEGRAPLLDHRVVEFAVRLPTSMRVRAGRGKHVLRELARRWLPAEVLDKPKQGFAIPLDEWFRGPLGEMAADLFAGRRMRERGWVRVDAATSLLEEHRAGAANRAESLWQILMLELWAERYMDMRDAAP